MTLRKIMNSRSINLNTSFRCWLTCCLAAATLISTGVLAAPQSSTKAPATSAAKPKAFDTPQQAAEALVAAAEKFDVAALESIFGSEGRDLIVTGEPARDKEVATAFAAQARAKMDVTVDPKNPNRAIIYVGKDDWPSPVPIVKSGGKWSFDVKSGRQEILYRRVGQNELDAIQICHGYVEAQHQYALQKREGYDVNQYAQRIVSTPGTQDGLAWQNADGTWGG